MADSKDRGLPRIWEGEAGVGFWSLRQVISRSVLRPGVKETSRLSWMVGLAFDREDVL